jgi:sugar lactone lactonase YvrE
MRGKAVGLMTLLILLIASTSFAAVCPQVTALGSLSGDGRYEPFRVAVAPSGSIYATDAQNDRVYLYGAGGERIKDIYVNYPLGVAVDDSGNVYVGSSDRHKGYQGEITVYDSGLNEQYTIGSGILKKPLGIAVDADKIYVADSKLNSIMVFNRADGSFLVNISDTAPGTKLVRPDNVFINPATGNLIVSDSALVKNECTGDAAGSGDCVATEDIQGTGVHEFTSDGVFVRSFGSHGYTETAGVLALIGGVAVDNSERTYISDRTKHSLHVFDSAGVPVCIAPYGFNPGAHPQGLAATADGRLFVGSSGKIVELGLDDFTKMVVSPTELSYAAQECGPQPAAKTVTVSNEGPGLLSYTVSSDAPWLTTSISSGDINGQGSVDITASVDKSGLTIGTHTATLTIASAGSTQTVAVTLEVLPPSTLSVSPSSLSFTVEGGVNPPAQSLNIQIVGGGSWSATSDKAWLGVSPSSGGSNIILTQVSVDAASIGADRNGSITVGGTCIAGGPVSVPVTVDVIAGGTIEVTTNNDDASFTISGPETYTGNGKTYSVSGATAGTYTIEFGDVEGHLSPESYSLDLTDGATVTFEGSYIDRRRELNILTTPGHITDGSINQLRVYELKELLAGNSAPSMTVDLVDGGTKRYWDNSIVASGDINGDGVEDAVISHDVGVVTVFDMATSSVMAEFMPFADRAYVDLAVADFDGNGTVEIVASATNWSAEGATFRVFSYEGGKIVDTGAVRKAYTGENWANASMRNNDRRGVRIATGDTNGDGKPEIITVQGGGYSEHYVQVRTWDVTTGVTGTWHADDVDGYSIEDTGLHSYYSDITAGDVDLDGADEVIVSYAPLMTSERQAIGIAVFDDLNSGGMKIGEVKGVLSIRGVEVAAGDINFDGHADIVIGEGAFREGDSSRVLAYDFRNGTPLHEFDAFALDVYGVRIATGQLLK